MADEEKNITVVRKKKIIGGHGGAHGGAWKVAYADFVTAMMAFFMVMWLMGSDEETKAAVESYFQGKTFDRDGKGASGQLRGGDASLKMEGANGRFEEKDLEKPYYAAPVSVEEQAVLRDLSSYFEGSAFTRDVDANEVRYTITPRVKFAKGSVDVPLDDESRKLLAKLTYIFNEHDGSIAIEAYADEAQDWALAYGRAISLKRYIESQGISSEKIIPIAGYVKTELGKVAKLDLKDASSARFILKRVRTK